MEITSSQISEHYKITLISLLLGACFVLTYYFHVILGTEVVFTHFFYIPIIMAAIWWKRKAFILTAVLSAFLLLTHLFVSITIPSEDLIRVFMFFFVTTVVVILSEQMEKSRKILEKSEKKYRSVVESAKEAIITVSKDGKIVSWNKGAEEIFGFSEAEMLNDYVTKIMPVKHHERFKKAFLKFKHPSKIYNNDMNEVKALRKNGEEFPFDISVVSWKTDEELFFTAIIRDITDRKKAENALIESERKFREIAENIEEVFWINDFKTNKMLYVSPAFEKIWGKSMETLYDNPYSWVKSIHPDDLERIGDDILSNLNNPENQIPEGFEYRIKRPDGSIRWLWSRSFPIKDASGDIERVVGVASDITARKEIENELKNSEEKFREVFNKVNDMMTLIEITEDDVAGRYIEVNEVVINKLGYSKDEFLQMTPRDIGISVKSVKNQISELINTGSSTFERIYYTKDGGEIPVEINSHIFIFKEKKLALSVARDITERKKAEKALKESEEKYRSLIESANDPISLMDSEGTILLVNPEGAHALGMEPSQIVGKSLMEVFPESAEQQMKIIRKVFTTGLGVEMDLPIIIGNHEKWFSTSAQPLFGPEHTVQKVQVISRDITDIKEAQKKLEKTLKEKEMLLKEIHHRVKNNLMVISSLLSIQSRYIKDKEALDIFKESQNRAKSMALIHERLYRSTDLKRIDIAEYIRTLSTDLFHTYVTDPSKIELKMDLEDIMIDINTSIPLGLIINELVTNAMKHAFPGDMRGEINISFHKIGDNLILEIGDNGVGFPEDIDYENTSSLGLQLVTSLSNQIDAEVKLKSENGTDFKISFKEKKY